MNTTHVDSSSTASCARNSDGQAFLQQLEKPRLGNFETELIIQRLRRRRKQTFRLREQADEPAVVEGRATLPFTRGR